jgi:hypothetical protein
MIKLLVPRQGCLAELEILSPKYDESWLTLKTLVNYSGIASNLPPDNADFVELPEFPYGVSQVEVCLDQIAITSGVPSSIIAGIWVLEDGEKSFLGFIGGNAGESYQIEKPFGAIARLVINLKEGNAIKFATNVFIDKENFALYNDPSTSNKFLPSNPGILSDTIQQLTLTAAQIDSEGYDGCLPGGLSGYIAEVINNKPVIIGATFLAGESLRINLSNKVFDSNGYRFPLPGIAAKFTINDIDFDANTIRVTGSPIDFSLLKNRQIRYGAFGSQPYFEESTVSYSNNTTFSMYRDYYISECTGSIGNQLIKISVGGVIPLRCTKITNEQIAYGYVFPFPYIEGITLAEDGQMLVDGRLVTFVPDFDYPVSITAGTPTTFTHASAHGFSNNQKVTIVETISPTSLSLYLSTYYVKLLTATTYYLTNLEDGIPLAFFRSGSGVSVNGLAATLSVATASVITYPSQIPTSGQKIYLSGTSLPGSSYTYQTLYASGTNCYQLSIGFGGILGVAFGSAGSNVRLTSYYGTYRGCVPIERKVVGAKKNTDNSISFYDSANNLITTNSPGSGEISAIAANAKISGKVLLRPIFE